MPLAIPSGLATLLAQPATCLCRLLTITLASGGQTFYFTDANSTISFGGNNYLPDPGVLVSAVSITDNSADNSASLDIAASENFLSIFDIRNGRLDGARFTMSITDWRNPDSYGAVLLFSGAIKDVRFNDKGRVQCDVDSKLPTGAPAVITKIYSQTCRATLGDVKCKVNLGPLNVGITVTALSNNGYSFASASLETQPTNRFAFGRIVWATGANAGLADTIAGNNFGTGVATTTLKPRNPIAVGDTGTMSPGCDKQLGTCATKFSNNANFRGEPYAALQLADLIPSSQAASRGTAPRPAAYGFQPGG
jgi:uncharacterized phage protein (TIGR02218 family)